MLPRTDFPAIFEFSTGAAHRLRGAGVFVVGRHPQSNLVLPDPACSRQQFRILLRQGGYVLEPVSGQVHTLCDGRIVRQAIGLKHGALIEVGTSRFGFLEHEDPGFLQRATAQPPPVLRGSQSPAPTVEPRIIVGTGAADPGAVTLVQPVVVTGTMLIGRDANQVQITLPHSRVSRVHARIAQQRDSLLLSDVGSANGTYLNGRRLVRPTTLKPNDQINIGPYALYFDGQCLLSRPRVDNLDLVGWHLCRAVRNRLTGTSLTLLDDLTLVIRPREFACLLGPSGSGKSTLLSALSARVPADSGMVTVNGQDLYGNFDALKQDLAVVPQHVALHDSLSLNAALHYTAQLRLPPDTSAQERREIVDNMLTTVGLSERKRVKIGNLSGGQLKRASLANEILSGPGILFLDEVTSGLDEQADREMMRLFRRIADTGKTVLCITHSSVNIEQNCDLVVILAEGGKLAFVGPPIEALGYFKIRRLGDLYDKLSEKTPEQWKQQYLQHPLCRMYVQQRLPSHPAARGSAGSSTAWPLARWGGDFFRQVNILTGRYLRLQLADLRSLATIFGQCLLVACLLIVLYGDLNDAPIPKRAANSANILFLLAISSLWFGCNNAAKEIVKERVIYLRESDVCLNKIAYYASKLLLMGTICILQVTILLVLVTLCTHLPGNFSQQWSFVSLLAAIGVGQGLLISAISKTNDNAIGMVPAVLIPQIILAGVIAPVDGAAKFMAQGFISAYWGYRGLAALLPDNLREALGAGDWSSTGAFSVLSIHFLLLVVTGIWALMRRK